MGVHMQLSVSRVAALNIPMSAAAGNTVDRSFSLRTMHLGLSGTIIYHGTQHMQQRDRTFTLIVDHSDCLKVLLVQCYLLQITEATFVMLSALTQQVHCNVWHCSSTNTTEAVLHHRHK